MLAGWGFVIAVSLANLAMGYFLAQLLGHGASWSDLLRAPAILPRWGRLPLSFPPLSAWPVWRFIPYPWSRGGAVEEGIAGSPREEPPRRADAAPPEPIEPPTPPAQVELPEAAPAADPTPETAGSTSAEASAGAKTPAEPIDPLEQVLREFEQEMAAYQSEVADVDRQVRQADPSANLGPQLAGLRRTSRECLGHQTERVDQLQQRRGESEALAAAAPTLEAAVEQHLEQLGSAIADLDLLEASEDQLTRERMLAETNRLAESCYELQESIDDTRRQATHSDGAPITFASLCGQRHAASLRELAAGFESLADFSGVCLALVDADHLRQVNHDHGPALVDDALRYLGGRLVLLHDQGRPTARLSGQRFAVAFEESDLDKAALEMERLRQHIERAQFQRGESEFQLTVSCAVVAGKDGDGFDSLLERAEATLLEAKRYGRNRTFVFQKNYPTPVVPPDLASEPHAVAI